MIAVWWRSAEQERRGDADPTGSGYGMGAGWHTGDCEHPVPGWLAHGNRSGDGWGDGEGMHGGHSGGDFWSLGWSPFDIPDTAERYVGQELP